MRNTVKLYLFITFMFPAIIYAYPLDGYKETGIRRVEAARLAVLGKMRGRKQPPRALLPSQYIELQLLGYPDLNLPQPDSQFTKKIIRLLGKERSRYGIER